MSGFGTDNFRFHLRFVSIESLADCGRAPNGDGACYNHFAVGDSMIAIPKVVFGAARFPKTTVGLWL